MPHRGSGKLVSVYLNETDQWHNRPLYLVLIERARRAGIVGATALRGIAGYGVHRAIHTDSLVDLSADLPIVLQFADTAEHIAKFLPTILGMTGGAFVTVVDVETVTEMRPAA